MTKEEETKKRKEYREKNIDKIRARERAQYWKHKEVKNKRTRLYYKKNKENVLSQQRGYQEKHREEILLQKKNQKQLHPLWFIFYSINKRCRDKNNKDYGGRGISVQDFISKEDFEERLLSSYLKHFKENDGDTSIDRIDVNGNYSYTNVRWATAREQANNRRTNTFLTFNNKTLTQAQWAREINIPSWVIQSRRERGWDVEKILMTPFSN